MSMSLFRKSEKQVAEAAALQAEIERLKALDVDSLAVVLLPGLRPDGPGTSMRVQQLCCYLVRDFPGAGQQKPLVLSAYVNDALKKLEKAELVSPLYLQRSPVWRLTPLGGRTLTEGTIKEQLRKVS
jgi:hypothetical protein